MFKTSSAASQGATAWAAVELNMTAEPPSPKATARQRKPSLLAEKRVGVSFCPRITRIDANDLTVGQPAWLWGQRASRLPRRSGDERAETRGPKSEVRGQKLMGRSIRVHSRDSRAKSRAPSSLEIGAWSFSGAWSLGLGALNSLRRFGKTPLHEGKPA